MSLTYRRPSILEQIPPAGHAVIEASAGTGKTYTIEQLVLDLVIVGKCPIEQILAVTFTEKATGELRRRIRALLEATLNGKGCAGSGGERRELRSDDLRALEEALFSFDRAPIFTIHSFCQRVLTDLAFESGSRFNLEVVDGRRALRRALRAELREHFATEAEAKARLEKYLENASSGTQGAVESIERLLWEAHMHRYLETGAPQENLAAVERFAREFDPKPLKKAYAGVHHGTRNKANTALDLIAEEFKRVGGTAAGMLAAMDPSVLDELPDFSKVNAALSANQPAREMHLMIERCAAALAPDTRILDTFLPRVEERLARDKRERGQIDYDDMLLSVWNALAGEGGSRLAQSLRSRLRFALLDEFQDTDYLQWKIFQRIFVARDSQCRLFVVGDPKQAIYAFRGADVHAYLAARDELTGSHNVKPVHLIDNFRSTGPLIKGLNLILDQGATPALMSQDTPYDHPVRCGRTELRAVDGEGGAIKPIAVMRFSAAGSFRVPPARAAVGRHIAASIRAILDPARGGIVVKDEGAKPRLVEANNIYVLTRSGAESAEIGEYLREQGVPYAFYKQDGLFQTPEAYDLADLLHAIEKPGSHSRQLKAWASPFFAVPLRDLFAKEEVTGDHPLLERLYGWHALAEEERFAELFDALLHQSGLVNRELFLANSERELTNYQHILEVLLTRAIAERLSLAEIIEDLEAYIQEAASPPGLNGNLQRIESERRAVQVMTVHMSKGLEADVVFLFGGLRKPPNRAKVCVYHQDGRRRVIASTAVRSAKAEVEAEQEREDRRLLYVAMTRARARLCLPYYPGGKLGGFYTALNNRLDAILRSSASGAKRDDVFEIQQVAPARAGFAAGEAALERKLKSWTPPQTLLREAAPEDERRFDALRKQHRAMVIRSYTSLARKAAERTPEPEDFKQAVDSAASGDLIGGRSVGIFLHEAIEQLDFKTLADPIDLAAWRERDEVKRLFLDAMRRRGVADARWFERGTEAVFNTLRSPIPLANGITVGPLFTLHDAPREMEFVYPIPEQAHLLLGAAGEENWRAERGYLKGFMDFVFEQDGRTYFADWKSDQLDDYGPATIAEHVKANYEMQAKIYCVGLVRLLRIRDQGDWAARFGGLLYVFLRAKRSAGASADGVYFRRPPWSEIAAYEKELMGVAAPLGAAS